MNAVVSELVKNYWFIDNAGKSVALTQLFAQKPHLVVLHNMGKTCPNCALWGDEFNAMRHHIEKIAAFCIIGPDDNETQKSYKEGRNWQANIVSAADNQFIQDMGFDSDGGFLPGVSIFQKQSESIQCVKQVNVVKDGRIPSVLEVLMMIPGSDTAKIAWS